MRGLVAVLSLVAILGCGQREEPPAAAETPEAPQHRSNIPPLDPTNIVSIAQGSEDHTTLVTAIVAADYVTSVAASGPLTVFAPTNAAFDALPEGTVESLLEPGNVAALREILKYHVTTSALRVETFRDGQTLGMANGAKATVRIEGDEVNVGGAKVLASIPASNGIVHVVDAVLLPPND